jgi:type IV pilus assembly protein PilB
MKDPRELAREAGVDFVEKIDEVPALAVEAVSRDLATRLSVMPIKVEGRKLQVALADPFNFDVIDTLSKELKFDIELAVAPPDQIARALRRYYGEL